MKLKQIALLLFLFLVQCAVTSASVTIDTVQVGDVGNPNDPATGNLYGGVNYAYNIGKYEVTVGQYAAFLNAVAATDTYGLFNTGMATDLNVAGISRSGSSGSYSYSPVGSADHPVTYVSWGDAARFANWLHNGQPNGAQNASTTEDGAYTLSGATSRTALAAVSRNAAATWFIPTENEWYKAAYYQPAAQGGDSDGYWTYPMQTNSAPFSDQPPGATPDNTRVGNFYKDDGTPNDYNDGYAVTGSTTYSGSQNYLTDVGAYTSSPSYYGTFDQAGNVWEWNETETPVASSSRGLRGGSWYAGSISALGRTFSDPAAEDDSSSQFYRGFRVASIPGAGGAGDFDANGVVNAADYVVWRKINGVPESYNTWRTNFGASAANGLTVPLSVPEPGSMLLLIAALVGTLILRGRSVACGKPRFT